MRLWPVLLAGVTACVLCPKPTPTPPLAPVGACSGLKHPPNSPDVLLLGPEQGCPAAFVACLDVDGGLALVHGLEASRSWEREAWVRCGPAQDGGL